MKMIRIQRWSSCTSFSTMGKKGLKCWYLASFSLLLTLGVTSSQEQNKPCPPSRCGIITNISYPFRLRDDPANCGDPKFELACENNVTLVHLYNGTYRVLAINYNNYTIRLVDPGIQAGNCSSLPRYSLSQSNFTETYLLNMEYDSTNPYGANLKRIGLEVSFKHIVYLNCSDPVRDDTSYLDTSPCVNWESKGGGHVYALAGDLLVKELKPQCRVKSVATISLDWDSQVGGGIKSYAEIHRVLSNGFEVLWWKRACVDHSCPISSFCSLNRETLRLQCARDFSSCYSPMGITVHSGILCNQLTKLRILAEDYLYGIQKGLSQVVGKDIDPHHEDYDFSLTNVAIILGIITGRGFVPYITVRFFLGTIFLSTLLIYIFRRRHLSMYENIEDFIRLQNLIPIRYSYKDLKKMSEGFKNKLGQGGFGTVYKGKLRSGPMVAIKMLGDSKTNDQEFISEVATIGRIHHFNVVHLVGFCIEGTKRALLYEFMSNGSLDKVIFSKGNISLSYHKVYEISLEIARGIAYLHHGCDMQILHFDIKPHNILLDDDFTPKISDFGLARLYAIDDSIVTLTAARGTIGYMAPELFYKNIGGVSYKADVYSFGMLLMEMASRRRNMNQDAEDSSEAYFPLWIYDQFNEEKDIEMEDLTEVDKNLARKMIIVALWCIQLKPIDRPSMNKVIEMLETEDVESLEMPPKPSLYPNERVLMDDSFSSSQTSSAISADSPSSLGEV
ncbi:probable LRR receptor-like serine/threonine-protein kinase At1g56130 [Neltuma alba]|uniref:probable LRR receptor-like serine/threonine-protein kinase At1g56130 n=1 Tax=Neltuma alba TaxID=207710 RepID=UPI0010A53528|nr:probable LRR receptor-like serine/threonine-protein kinase At1g56130 [Prosopis alba]